MFIKTNVRPGLPTERETLVTTKHVPLRLIHIGDFFKREASDFQWILVYSLVLFRLVIFQRFSEARKKLLAFKWVLYPFKQAIFVNKQIKYKNRLEKKPM